MNQQPIDTLEGSPHLLNPLLTKFAARNRTRMERDKREESCGLFEIDSYATNAKHKEQVPDDKVIVLKLMQSGPNWTKAFAAKTGQADADEQNDRCDLCGQRETSDHCWHCPSLKTKARELDVLLSETDPNEFTAAVR